MGKRGRRRGRGKRVTIALDPDQVSRPETLRCQSCTQPIHETQDVIWHGDTGKMWHPWCYRRRRK